MSLEVFDTAGRRAATLIGHELMAAGPHEVTLGSGALKAGLYFACLEFGFQTATHKLIVIQ